MSSLATTSKATSENDRAEKRDKTNEKEILKNEKNRKEVKLASVKNLRKVVEDTNHRELRDIVANHTFVGKVALNCLGFNQDLYVGILFRNEIVLVRRLLGSINQADPNCFYLWGPKN